MFLIEKKTQVKCNGKKWKDRWEDGTPGIYQLKGESVTSVAKTALVNEPDLDLESADKIFGKMQTIIMGAATGRSAQALPAPTDKDDEGVDMANFWQSFGSGGMPVAAPKAKAKAKSGTKRRTSDQNPESQKQARVSSLVRMQPDHGNAGVVKDESAFSGAQDADEKWIQEFGETLREVLSIKLKYEIPKDDAETSHSKSALSAAQKHLSSMFNQAWMFPEHIGSPESQWWWFRIHDL